jgi:hypothetical protein
MGSPRISTPSGITASAVAVIGVPTSANTWILARGSANADAPRSYYFALNLNDPIAPIAAAITFRRAAHTTVASIT